MDTFNLDKDCSALEALFQTVMSDMKNGYPVLEDFSMKASKLHTALRTTIVALGAFLETFQKVADMATNTRGATRDIGAALTRLCIRHKNIDAKLRAFNGAILECLVTPLQEKIEEWKRTSGQMDKDHMKEYKKVRADWKKASENTLKLQKKAKKGKASMNTQLDVAIREFSNKYQVMEESSQNAARLVLMEERSRYCNLVSFLKPVLIRELSMIQEIGHLQEIVTNLSQQTSDPQLLPPASEQVVLDTTKGSDAHRSFQNDYVNELTMKFLYLEKTPPSSPSSLGSRKSSMCSISSINSSSSSGSKAHSSPAHHCRPRTVSQRICSNQLDMTLHDKRQKLHSNQARPQQVPVTSTNVAVTPRQTSVSSQDSGFTSQDHIPVVNSKQASPNESQSSHTSANDDVDNEATTPSSDYQQWTETRPDVVAMTTVERPHTISSAYERSHVRPQLSSYTFEAPDVKTPTNNDACSVPTTPSQYARPFVGARRGSIRDSMVQDKPPTGPRPRSKAVPLPSVPVSGQAIYANVDDIMNSANHAGDLDFDNHPHLRKMSLPATECEHHGPDEQCHNSCCHGDMSDLGDDDVMQSADLARAIEELDAQTHALNTCNDASDLVAGPVLNNNWHSSPSNTNKQMPNSLELAEAIRELEANTASLQSSCGPNAHKSIMSLQCSSGYATMTNTPASSDDTIASGDLDLFNPDLLINNNLQDHHLLTRALQSKYCTLPRNHADMSRAFKQMIMSNNMGMTSSASTHRQRPFSASGLPAAHLGGLAALRRGSLPCKPPPPVRRSSSHSGQTGENNGRTEEVTYASPHHTPTQHRRANSVSVSSECHYYPSTQSEHGTSASGQNRRSDMDAQIYATAQVAQGPHFTPPKVPPPTIYAYATPPPTGPSMTGPNMSTPNTPRPNPTTPPLRQCVSNPNTPKVHIEQTKSHASVIDTLNQKFASLNRTDSIDDLPLPPMPDELLPAPPPEMGQTNTMLNQIREGVQLRRVSCNDRSQPKM